MGKNKFKSASDLSDEASEEGVESLLEERPEVMQTVYTHGKVFKIPAKDSVEDFLKKKFPKEHK